MIAIFTVLIIIALSILVTRVSAVALAHTGLSRDAARFQARSAFTGVGYTTREAERVTRHPVRRRIAPGGRRGRTEGAEDAGREGGPQTG